MKHPEQESRQHFDSGLYCAESVLLAVANHLGIHSDLIPRIATGFCTGLSGTSGMCGALAGGIMGLNLAYGRNQGSEPVEKNYAMVQALRQRFEDRFGATHCTALLGCDMGTAEGEATFMAQGLAARCGEFVGNATRMTIELVEQG
jgi:C_GCAxxG_C_C family probable redox protein